MTDLDIKRENFIKKFKWGGLALAVVIVVPLLFSIAMAVLGTLVAAGVAVFGGIALVNAIPVFAMKAANWKLKAIKQEARENPIETAQLAVQQKAKELDLFKAETQDRLAKGNAMIEDVIEMAKTDPEGAKSFEGDIASFRAEMKSREERLRTMIEEYDDISKRVSKAARRWALAEKHSAIRTPSEQQSEMNKIVLEEALGAVTEAAHKHSAAMVVQTMTDNIKREITDKRAQGALEQTFDISSLTVYTMDNNILELPQGAQKVISK